MGSRKKQKLNNAAKPDNSPSSSTSSKAPEASEAHEVPTQPQPPAEHGNAVAVSSAASSAASSVAASVATSLASSLASVNTIKDAATGRLSNSLLSGVVTESSVANTRSWYGSWKGQTRPAVDAGTDNVQASPSSNITNKPSVSERRLSKPNPPSPRRIMSGTGRPHGKGNAIPASISKLSVTSNGLEELKNKPNLAEDLPSNMQIEVAPGIDPPLPPNPSVSKKLDSLLDKDKPAQEASAGWFGWWSRPDGYIETHVIDDTIGSKEEVARAARHTPLPGLSPVEELTQSTLEKGMIPPNKAEKKLSEQSSTKNARIAPTVQPSSWFWMWSSQQNSQPPPTTGNEEGIPQDQLEVKTSRADIEASISAVENSPEPLISKASSSDGKDAAMKTVDRKKSTGWAFWSTETPGTDRPGDVHKQVGELAVANTPSQTNPEAAQFNEQEESTLKERPKALVTEAPQPVAQSIRGKSRKQGRESESASSNSTKTLPSRDPTRKATARTKEVTEEPKKDLNLLLPALRDSYSLAQQPSLLQQIRQYFIDDKTETPHLHMTARSPRIKRAVAIGIHGFFPSPLFQTILGQPTGTSIRFANNAAQAIKAWTEGNGYECEIEKIALEGEGFIADRVDTLWKLLLNWIEHIRKADFILVACHSQGVPVSITLVAKLIAFGCVSSTRIGVCAMAGVNLGPFAEYKTRMLGASALELFEFADPTSKVSKMYQTALEEVLKFGVKIIYVGSIDDQLVSLESSTFSTINHPYIYRAVFVDGRLHAADFVTHLVGFCLKLRNLGISDHGLIRELSPALAGSLYTGEGHSTLHNYLPVYQLAVAHALDTTTFDSAVPVIIKRYEGPPGAKDANPYFLPWAMRGILEEDVVRRELGAECKVLLKLFEEWKPVGKGLKDVKFRLEAIRSKL